MDEKILWNPKSFAAKAAVKAVKSKFVLIQQETPAGLAILLWGEYEAKTITDIIDLQWNHPGIGWCDAVVAFGRRYRLVVDSSCRRFISPLGIPLRLRPGERIRFAVSCEAPSKGGLAVLDAEAVQYIPKEDG